MRGVTGGTGPHRKHCSYREKRKREQHSSGKQGWEIRSPMVQPSAEHKPLWEQPPQCHVGFLMEQRGMETRGALSSPGIRRWQRLGFTHGKRRLREPTVQGYHCLLLPTIPWSLASTTGKTLLELPKLARQPSPANWFPVAARVSSLNSTTKYSNFAQICRQLPFYSPN